LEGALVVMLGLYAQWEIDSGTPPGGDPREHGGSTQNLSCVDSVEV